MALKETIKEIILNAQGRIMQPPLYLRDFFTEHLPRKATIITGVRRCGKTMFEQLYMQQLITSGVPKAYICPLDFSDDRLFALRTEEPGVVAEAYYELFPDAHEQKVYFFFDEIQYLNRWELFVNRLQTTENCEVNITGSSAKMLTKEIATEFGGRSLNWELFPFSYYEFVLAQQQIAAQPFSVAQMTTMQRELCKHWFELYCERGGFPESVGISDDRTRVVLFQNIAETAAFRDVIKRHNLPNPNEVSRLQQLLFGNMAKLISFSKLQQRMSGEQFKISKEMVKLLVSYFEDAYIFFTVEILSANAAVRSTNPKKLYCADHALALACTAAVTENKGFLLENIAFLHLRRAHAADEIHYYKTANGKEIDFVVGELPNVQLVQVSYDISEPETEKRELSALEKAMTELHLSESLLITHDTEKDCAVNGGTVHVLPMWKWLLVGKK